MNPEKFLQDILKFESELKSRALTLYKGDDSRAEDLLQDTIIKALKNEDKFEKGTNLKAWLKTILYHLFVNGHRRVKRYHEILLDHKSEVRQYTSTTKKTEEESLHMLEMRSLQNLLREELDDIFYEVLQYIDIEGRTYRETAEYLNLPVGTVMSRLHRARHKSRDILLDKYDHALLELFVSPEALEASTTC